MLARHIHNLRQKPESVRRQAAMLWSVLITFIIFLLWILNFNYLGSINVPEPAVEMNENAVPEISWSEAQGRRLNRGWDRATAFLGAINK